MTAKPGNKMSAVRATIENAIGCDLASADDRELLVAYLKYAVQDVAEINETSAFLLQMAIAGIEDQPQDAGLSAPQ